MAESALPRSWLFEVVNRQTRRIETSFTLILPPQSYTIREKQRVTVTKTFDNAFVDDYGSDNIEITIKGISGTAHVFPTYRTSGAAGSVIDTSAAIRSTFAANEVNRVNASGGEGYTGKGAFYTFRNDIMRYKDRGDWDKKELRVYDLADEQSYKCILLEFSVDRSKDQPFWYPFTISLLVYARLDSKKAARPKEIPIAKDPEQALDDIDNTMSTAQAIYQGVQTVLNSISTVQSAVADLRGKIRQFTQQVRRVVESPLTAVKYLIGTLQQAGGIVYDTYQAGRLTVEEYAGATEMIDNSIRNALAIYGFAITEGSQQSQTLVVEGSDGITADPDTGSVEPRASTSTFEMVGLTTHTVVGEETLQDIALEEMGDSNLWPYIATVNDISDNADISPGDILYIPVSESTALEPTDAFIISEDALADPYGADIQILDDGSILNTESNDVALVTGLPNLMQAINTRLRSVQGSLIKQTAIGISGGAGLAGTSLSLSYLRMSIRATLLEDPRIEEVKNLVINLNGDTVNASMDIRPVSYNLTLPVSVTL